MINTNSSTLSIQIYQAGLLLLAVALPFSNFLMSVSQFMLVGAWLVGGDYKTKLNRFFQNKPAVIFSSFYILHLFGLIYTSDLSAGINDLRIKLPLLMLPFILSGMPRISAAFLHIVLWGFVASVLLNTALISINNEWSFISPIRFSMMVSFSIFILLYLGFSQNSPGKKIISIVLAGWLVLFLVQFPYDTGIVTFACSVFFLVFIKIIQAKKLWVKIIFFLAITALSLSTFFLIRSGVKNFFGDTASGIVAQEQTANGEQYVHYTERKDIENGNYVWQYIAWAELENSWNEKSLIAFSGNDSSGQPLSATILRFLTSKGFRKDAEGISKLSGDEIRAIENGTANVRYMDGLNPDDRLYELIWSLYHYQIGNDPQGNSVAQRFVFWKAGWKAFLQAPVFGSGTGSVVSSLHTQYENMHTTLDQSHRLKTHNQYLATAVALGCVGLMWLILSFLLPVFFDNKWKDVLFLIFLLIVFAALFVEDTLETQAGVTFVAFFFSLFLFSSERNKSFSPV